MANSNKPRGLQPFKAPGGGEPKVGYYAVSSTLTIALGLGQPMMMSSNGFAAPLRVTSTVTQASLLGALAEFRPAVAVTKDVAIWDDADQLFICQYGGTTAMSRTFIGGTLRLHGLTGVTGYALDNQTTGAVNTTTMLSRATVMGAAGLTNSTCKVIDYVRGLNNSLTGTYCDLVVKIDHDKHVFGSGAGIA